MLYFYNKLEVVVPYGHLLLALVEGWCPKLVGKFGYNGIVVVWF